jgi:hypothetical protein
MRSKAAGAMANERSTGTTVHRALAVVNAMTSGGSLTRRSRSPCLALVVTSTLKVILLAYSCAEHIDRA